MSDEEGRMADRFETPLSELPGRHAGRTALARAGIRTVADALSTPRDELLGIPGFGGVSMGQLDTLLADSGFPPAGSRAGDSRELRPSLDERVERLEREVAELRELIELGLSGEEFGDDEWEEDLSGGEGLLEYPTTVGRAFDAETLPPRARAALAHAITVLTDQAFDDCRRMDEAATQLIRDATRSGQPATPDSLNWAEAAANTHLGAHLPERYLPRYNSAFFKRFAVCLVVVGQKLAERRWPGLSCVAEELALRALIEEAESALEMGGLPDFDFGYFEDEAFEDLDFEYMFQGHLDGIDRSEVAARLSMGSLAFEDWFRPFGAGGRGYPALHPYVNDDPHDRYPAGSQEDPGE